MNQTGSFSDAAPTCKTCGGSGELPTDFGPADCPDCGGAGHLPSKSTLVDWRTRDIERAHAKAEGAVASDVAWLIAELRIARGALNEVIALAHDIDDGDEIGRRIRFVANRALGTYPVTPLPDASA